jgi:flagellar biosynthesis anti-sigma factor FlgM
MIISKAQVQNIMKIYGKEGTSTSIDKVKAPSAAAKTDELSLSNTGRVMQKAMLAAKQSPDIRWDKVNQLKEKLAADTLEVSDQEIAEKILEEALMDMDI